VARNSEQIGVCVYVLQDLSENLIKGAVLVRERIHTNAVELGVVAYVVGLNGIQPYLVIGQQGNSNQDLQSNRLTVALSRLKSPASQGRQDGRIEPAVRSLQYRETLEFAFDVHDSKDDDYIVEIRSNQLRVQSGQFLGKGKWRRDSFRG
jgi:hypothetical protein